MIEIRAATTGDIPAIAQVHVKVDWNTYAPLFGADAYMLTIAESVGWAAASTGTRGATPRT